GTGQLRYPRQAALGKSCGLCSLGDSDGKGACALPPCQWVLGHRTASDFDPHYRRSRCSGGHAPPIGELLDDVQPPPPRIPGGGRAVEKARVADFDPRCVVADLDEDVDSLVRPYSRVLQAVGHELEDDPADGIEALRREVREVEIERLRRPHGGVSIRGEGLDLALRWPGRRRSFHPTFDCVVADGRRRPLRVGFRMVPKDWCLPERASAIPSNPFWRSRITSVAASSFECTFNLPRMFLTCVSAVE